MRTQSDPLRELRTVDRAFVFGLGGGGDIVGAIPTGEFLLEHGVEVSYGGIAWEPVPRDTRPGPRSLAELTNIEPVADYVARCRATTRTIDGNALAETGVASVLDDPVFVLDVSDGAQALADSVQTFVNHGAFDAVVGVDVGGDVLAEGSEPGIKSPLVDAIGLHILCQIDCPSLLGMIGYGSDGELSREEIDSRVAKIAQRNGLVGAWGITPTVQRLLDRLLTEVDTEASRLAVAASRGQFGEQSIRGGHRIATTGPASAVTFYFRPEVVASISDIYQIVTAAADLEGAAHRLTDAGIQTEFETETQRLSELQDDSDSSGSR